MLNDRKINDLLVKIQKVEKKAIEQEVVNRRLLVQLKGDFDIDSFEESEEKYSVMMDQIESKESKLEDEYNDFITAYEKELASL